MYGFTQIIIHTKTSTWQKSKMHTFKINICGSLIMKYSESSLQDVSMAIAMLYVQRLDNSNSIHWSRPGKMLNFLGIWVKFSTTKNNFLQFLMYFFIV